MDTDIFPEASVLCDIEQPDIAVKLLPKFIELATESQITETSPLYALLELVEQRLNKIEANDIKQLSNTESQDLRAISKYINALYQQGSPTITHEVATILLLIGVYVGRHDKSRQLSPLVKTAIDNKMSQKSGVIARCAKEEESLYYIHQLAISFYGDMANHNVKASTFCRAACELMQTEGRITYTFETVRSRLKERGAFPEKSLTNGRGSRIDANQLKNIWIKQQ
ncbi:hypothetical protein [uncultured Photobacterium sp.]|uniref:hypothetical protein n=1 Tax=uncultured Photobacterium sp. TaxID=173973 RepID=UPI00260896C1|nr:hypothetical protein [uncultured Photobacterium sp.]